MPSEDNHIKISLIGTEEKIVTLDEAGLFLYDFTTLYELIRLALDPKYEDFKFSRFSLYRNGRPLQKQDKLSVESIKHQSPFEFVVTIDATTVAAIGAVATLVLIFKEVAFMSLNHKKLRLDIKKGEIDIEKGELEIEKLKLDTKKTDLELRRLESGEQNSKDSEFTISLNQISILLDEREASEYIGKAFRKCDRSPVQIKELYVDVVSNEIEVKDETINMPPIEQEPKKSKRKKSRKKT